MPTETENYEIWQEHADKQLRQVYSESSIKNSSSKKKKQDKIKKKLKKKEEAENDESGGAKWCTRERFTEMLDRYDMSTLEPTATGGVVLASGNNECYIDGEDNHTIIFGATGSQKTRRLCMPTILSLARAGDSMVIADCKGEIYREMFATLDDCGYRILNLDLRNPVNSLGWNPLSVPYKLIHSGNPVKEAKGQEMVYDLAECLSPMTSEDPFWDIASQDLIAGAIFLLFEKCTYEQANMSSVQNLITQVGAQNPRLKWLISKMDVLDPAFNCLSGTLENAESTRRCIIGMARKALRPFTSNLAISSMLSNNDIDASTMVDNKTAIFITVPDDRRTYNALVTMFVKQSYSTLVDMAGTGSTGRLPRDVMFVIDEFGSFPAIPDMDSVISASRSRGVRFLLILQTMSQLEQCYNRNTARTILGNCNNLIFITSREIQLLEYISTLVGENSKGKRLITVSQLQRLSKSDGEILVLHEREYAYISQVVDISEYDVLQRLPEETVISRTRPAVFDLDETVHTSESDDLFGLLDDF